MTNTLANLARMTTSTTGTGTITLGSAVDGFLAFADELSSGDVITYAIEDGNQREIGQGTFTVSGATHTLTRSTVYASTQSGSQISLSGSAQVFVTAAAEDFGRDPKSFGAVGDGVTDDTAALQAWIDHEKTFSQYTLPGSSLTHRSLRRNIDLQGDVYLISDSLDLGGAHGLMLYNGTLIADNGVAWGGAPMIDITTGFQVGIDQVTLQCDGVANGLLSHNATNTWVKDSRIYGWGEQSYGVRLSPGATSQDSVVSGCKIQGWTTAENDITPGNATASAVDIQCNDTRVVNNTMSHGLQQISLTGGGCEIGGNHLYSGYPTETDQVGILVTGAAGVVMVGNYIDNCCVKLTGASSTLYKQIVGNYFLSNTDDLSACVILAPTSASQTLADLSITGNRAHGNYDRFVKIDTTSGSYAAINRGLVCDNVMRSLKSGYGAYPSAGMETRGNVEFTVVVGDFSTNQLTLDLNNVLLLPGANNPLQYVVNACQSSLNTKTLTGSYYNSATGKLTVEFDGTWAGTLCVMFDQSRVQKALTPD